MQSVYFQEKTERTISALAFTATATLESMEDLQQLSSNMNQMLYGFYHCRWPAHCNNSAHCCPLQVALGAGAR